jgi:SAM-dependent methyltransferase
VIAISRFPCRSIHGKTYLKYHSFLEIWGSVQKGLVLDAGCGPSGLSSPHVGVDLSKEYVKSYVRKRREKHGVVASLTSLPFKTGAFGAVLSIDVLEHIEDKTKAIDEMCRVGKTVFGCTSNLLNPIMLLDTIMPRIPASVLAGRITPGFAEGSHVQRHGLRCTIASINRAFEKAGVKVTLFMLSGPFFQGSPWYSWIWVALEHLFSKMRLPLLSNIIFKTNFSSC